MSDMRSRAVALAERGFRVFKLIVNDKEPAVPEFYRIASSDPDRVYEMWTCNVTRESLHNNIGIATGEGLLVLDIDVKKNRAGDKSLKTLIDAGLISLDGSYVVRTPSGGLHVYCGVPADLKISGKTNFWPGIDLRGYHNYVCAEGSEISSGGYITERDGNAFLPLRDELVQLLPRAMERVASPSIIPGAELDSDAAIKRGIEYLQDKAPEAVEGNRGITAYKVACELRGYGISEPACVELMAEHWNPEKVSPPVDGAELETRVRNAFLHAKLPLGHASPEFQFTEVKIEEEPGLAMSDTNARIPVGSDEALALRFATKHADDLRYVSQWGKWMHWDGCRWQFDETRKALHYSRQVCRAAASEVNKENLQRSIASGRTINAVESLAKADPRLAASINQWDSDPWLLCTPSGTVDLRTGELRASRPDDFVTKITAVAPGGACPTWRSFLHRITDGDEELISFLQRVAGYSLSGDISEHALFFAYGSGQNGKSVFINALSGILNDYHTTAPMETFTAAQFERHTTDLAGLRGARLVTAIETEEGRNWAEARIKNVTGGDKISARFMRQDFFTFFPAFKLFIAGNHKPGLKNVDNAIRQRLHLIPFAVTIPPGERRGIAYDLK